MFVKSYAPIII